MFGVGFPGPGSLSSCLVPPKKVICRKLPRMIRNRIGNGI